VITLRKVDKIRKENFEELIQESKTCLYCFAAKLKNFPYCVLHAEAFAYKVRVKLVKDYQNTIKALMKIHKHSEKLNSFIEYIMDEPKFQYIFTLKGNKVKGWKLRASFERVKKKEYPSYR